MNKIPELFKQLNLGEVIQEPLRVTGGLLHHMYKVSVKDKEYAVKVLNPIIMKRKPAMGHYIFSEAFARHAYKSGIKSVHALKFNDKVVQQCCNQHYLVFPWIEGKTLHKEHIDQSICKKIGTLLAKLHNLNFEEVNENGTSIDSIDWDQYIPLASKTIWFDEFNSSLEKIKMIEKKAINALRNNRSNVIGHRDLDPKNIMWQGDMEPVVIDWESAGPVNAGLELLNVALDWSGGGQSKLEFQSVLQAYSETKEIDLYEVIDVIYAINDGKLKWLDYNIKRSLGIESSNEEEQLLGTKEVISTLKDIMTYVEQIPYIEVYIEELL
ncbi:MAG: phosphotransferase [Clostridiales bacterium]|nr:phosphotransferase [Clostridiales bacterium]